MNWSVTLPLEKTRVRYQSPGLSYLKRVSSSVLSHPEKSFVEIDKDQTNHAFDGVTSRSAKQAARGEGKAQVAEDWDGR